MPLSGSLWNDLSDIVFDVWDWRVSRSEPILSCWHDLLFLFWLLLFYFLFLPSRGWLCGVGVVGLIECSHSLPALHIGLQLIIIITNIGILFLFINKSHLKIDFIVETAWDSIIILKMVYSATVYMHTYLIKYIVKYMKIFCKSSPKAQKYQILF